MVKKDEWEIFMNQYMKKGLFLVLSALLLLGAWSVFRSIESANMEDANEIGQSLTTKVMQMDLVDEIFADGFLEIETKNIYAEVSGIVEEVLVQEGDWITEGDVILILSKDAVQAQIEDAILALSDAAIDYEASLRNYESGSVLYDEGAITLNDYETRKENYERALNNMQIKEQVLERLYEDYDNTEIKANVSGRLLLLGYDVSDKISEDDKIAEIAISDHMTLLVSVEEYDAPQMSVGTPADVFVPALGKSYKGFISFISPMAKIGSAVPTVETLIELEEQDELLISGYSAEITIQTVNLPGAVAVPYDSIQMKQGLSYVYLVNENDTVSMVEVSTGYEDNLYIQIMNEELLNASILARVGPGIQDGMTIDAVQVLWDDSTETASPGLIPLPGSGMGGGTRVGGGASGTGEK